MQMSAIGVNRISQGLVQCSLMTQSGHKTTPHILGVSEAGANCHVRNRCRRSCRTELREFANFCTRLTGQLAGGRWKLRRIFLMSAWAGRVATHYFTAALAAQIALSGAALPVFAQDQQDQQQRQPELQPQRQPQPQLPQQPQPPPPQQALTQQQVQQLVAPIALYPDALLAQVLTASTYPLEVTMAARWSEKNPNPKTRLSKMQCRSSNGIQASRD